MKSLSSLVFACLVVTAGCSDNQSNPADKSAGTGTKSVESVVQSFDTPEAVFHVFSQSMQEENWRSAVTMITNESQQMIVMGMVMQASFMTMDDQAKGNELEQLFKKHGLDEEVMEAPGEEEVDVNQLVKDLPAFVGDLAEWIKANADDAEEGFAKMTKLYDVKIEGDAASALVETEMGPQPMEFRKVEGQWKLHLAMEPPPAPSIDELGIDFENTGDGEIGLMQLGEKKSGLNHAFAYHGKFFDEPCVYLVLSAFEVSEEKQSELEKDLKDKDGDAVFFAGGPNVALTLSPEGELMSMFAWIDNTSTSRNRGPAVDVQIKGNTIRGRAGMARDSDKEEGLQFQAKFETSIRF